MNNNFKNSNTSTKNSQQEWWLSWPFIVIICIIFWPVGLFLIWKKTTVDTKASIYSGKVISIFGWISLAIVFLGLCVCIPRGFKSDDISTIIFFLLAGVGLILLGKRLKNNANKFIKYISVIVNDGVTDINNIAAAIPTSYETTKKDLQKMIDKGFFEMAYIDESSQKIVFPKKSQEPENDKPASSNETVKMQVVTCKGCGAQNSIPAGTVGECEFCGSKIQAE